MAMIKECNVLGHADRKGKFTSEILIYSKEKEEQLKDARLCSNEPVSIPKEMVPH